MQSRKVENTFGRGLVTLMTVATLFFSVALPTSGFAKPEGDPQQDEVRLFHKVWKDKKWVETHMKKFSAEDLAPKDDKPSEKVQAWMDHLSNDEAKVKEFVSKFVTEPGTHKEVSEPFKMVQAVGAVLVQRTKDEIKKLADDQKTDDKKAEIFKAEAKKLWDWMKKSGLEKTYGTKFKSFLKLLAKLLGSDDQKFKVDDKEVKGIRPSKWADLENMLKKENEEDLIKKLFEDEDKLGEAFASLPKEAPGDDEEPEPKPKKKKKEERGARGKQPTQLGLTPEQVQQMIAEALAAQQQGVGEVDLSALEGAVDAFCRAAEDKNDDIDDLLGVLDQLRRANDDDNFDDNNDAQDILNALARRNNGNNDDQGEQAPIAPPAAAAPPAEQPQQANNDNSGLPQIPQAGNLPPVPQQIAATVNGDPIKARNTLPTGPQIDISSTDTQLAAARRSLRRLEDGGAQDLLGDSSKRFRAYLPLPQQLQLAEQDKGKFNAGYLVAKRKRDQLSTLMDQTKKKMNEFSKGYTDEQYAQDNPADGQVLVAMKEKLSELKKGREKIAKQAEQRDPQTGAPMFANGEQKVSEIDSAIAAQEAEIRKEEEKKQAFIRKTNADLKLLEQQHNDLQLAMDDAQAKMDEQKSKFEEADALAAQLTAALAQGQQQQLAGTIPTVGGSRAVGQPQQSAGGFNRFNTPGFTGAPTGTPQLTSTGSTGTGSGEFRGRLSGQR